MLAQPGALAEASSSAVSVGASAPESVVGAATQQMKIPAPPTAKRLQVVAGVPHCAANVFDVALLTAKACLEWVMPGRR